MKLVGGYYVYSFILLIINSVSFLIFKKVTSDNLFNKEQVEFVMSHHVPYKEF